MKKSILRLIAISGMVIFSLSSFAGCSSTKPVANNTSNESKTAETASSGKKEFKNKELEVAVFQGAYGRDYWDAISEQFMKDYPGTKITITANPKIGDMIRPKFVSNNPPDVVYLNEGDGSGLTRAMIKDKSLVDISDVFESKALDQDIKIKDEILPGILESKQCSPYGGGKIYLAPYNYSVMGLWYNKTLFDKEGIKTPKTWDEFFALNDTAKKLNRALFTYQGIYPGYLEEILFPAVYSAGGQDSLDKLLNFGEGFWKSDAAKKSLGIFDKIAKTDNALMPGTIALNHTQSQTEFMKGKAMFITNGAWFESEMKDAPREEGFQFGFAGIPAFKAGDPVTYQVNSEQIWIPSKAKNVELAKEFLKYLYTKNSVKLNGDKAKGVFAVKGAVDAVKDYISPSTYNTYKAVEAGMKPVSGTYAPLATGSKIKIDDAIYKPITSIMNKDLSVDQYAEELEKVYKQIRDELAVQK